MNKVTAMLASALLASASALSLTSALAQQSEERSSEPSNKETGQSPDVNDQRQDQGEGPNEDSRQRTRRGDSGNDEPSPKREPVKTGDGKPDARDGASERREANEGPERKSKAKSADRQDSKGADKAGRKSNQAGKEARGDGGKDGDKEDRASTARPAADERERKRDEANEGSAQSRKDRAKQANVSEDNRRRVRDTLKGDGAKQVTKVDIDVNVGRRLPRDWDYRPIPRSVIAIVPEYEGYRYVYVEDRYVIVDPETYEVVYVLDEGGSATGRSTGEGGSGATACETTLSISEVDQAYVYETVRDKGVTVQIGDLEVGGKLPGDARVEVFPTEVTRRISVLDNCRFAVAGEKIIVVDPVDGEIVAIIED